MRSVRCIAVLLALLSIVDTSSLVVNENVGKCLRDLSTQELTSAYNYLQLSSKFGTTSAYPGFSSMFTKLSDDDTSKAYDIVKFLALRKGKIDRLINKAGITIRNGITSVMDIRPGLTEARKLNKETWEEVIRCHAAASNASDANVQDYLESHVLEHHIEVEKLLADFEHRLDDARASDKKLVTFMLDEELLNTYGDRRKDIFS